MFFNQFGWNDTYGGGFPSRYKYAEEKLLDLNDHGKIVSAIEQAIDLRNFIGTEFEIEQLVEADQAVCEKVPMGVDCWIFLGDRYQEHNVIFHVFKLWRTSNLASVLYQPATLVIAT